MMALKQADPVLALSAHGDRTVPTPRTTFGLLDLPVELRNAIYVNLIHDQPLRICPARHPLRYADDQQCLAYQESKEACFYIELLRCANRHYQHLVPPDKTSYSRKQSTLHSTKQMDDSLLPPIDVLNFMRCCRTICIELEPMFWSAANFAMGISQFGSFYDDVLSRKILGSDQPRSHLISRLQVAVPHVADVMDRFTHNFRSNVSAATALDDSVARSVALLSTEFPNLHFITLTTGVLLEETSHLDRWPRDYLADYYLNQEENPISKQFYLQFLDLLVKRFQHGISKEVNCYDTRNKVYLLPGVPKSALIEMIRRHIQHCERKAGA
jgi:hypothetical protein